MLCIIAQLADFILFSNILLSLLYLNILLNEESLCVIKLTTKYQVPTIPSTTAENVYNIKVKVGAYFDVDIYGL